MPAKSPLGILDFGGSAVVDSTGGTIADPEGLADGALLESAASTEAGAATAGVTTVNSNAPAAIATMAERTKNLADRSTASPSNATFELPTVRSPDACRCGSVSKR
jgi:hypothetical protein